ncbi:hypothetical protein [Thalassobacillus pellis]|uniref:hypothetical protein n=1 Tax=Thalassobacillus pellis TaxID=748008 RepID=UPI0019604823|nr:hypothetical protein [Thalassobacillus pellis]MBM7553007.1 hypothetical protein [Thalassobacillus pellis]
MIWLYFLVPLAILIAIALYVEKRSNKDMDDATMNRKDKETLEQDYLERGAQHETDHPKNL